MKVKATIKFYDREADTLRDIDDAFEVEDSRGKKLIGLGYVEKVTTKATAKTTTAETTTTAKSTAKKKTQK